MPRMTTVDAEIIERSIDDIATVRPMFRSEEEMTQYVNAVNRIAELVGVTVPWGKEPAE